MMKDYSTVSLVAQLSKYKKVPILRYGNPSTQNPAYGSEECCYFRHKCYPKRRVRDTLRNLLI